MLNSIFIPVITLTVTALVLGISIVLVSKKFHVDEDPLVEAVVKLLPGANCGACGQAGCSQFAVTLVATRDPNLACPALSADGTEQIGAILGMELSGMKPVICTVKCQGTTAVAKQTAEYHGIMDCWAAKQAFHGTKVCPYACLGLGSCLSACTYDAMRIVDGIVEIIEENCVGCGLCIKECPVNVLELQEKKPNRYLVACRSTDKGAATKKYCEVGCIGCKKCEKACPAEAITVDNFCAVIDQSICTSCGACIEACPTHAIVLKEDNIRY
ncbi:MAG TPA: RnfABCDGE type electron transport complex subunit B [Syntrophales bacterium]|nr:RnfABCDGE type electron transport complex subunit B [Syntrophales bacterium]HPQ44499.1 RnfABCDGE type electron transport complex subunit B [Syntrophales bacterium]